METVNIGIITNNEIIKEQKNHIFNLLKNILVNLNLISSNYFFSRYLIQFSGVVSI
mgnify:FL=1